MTDDWRQEYTRRLGFWQDILNCWLALLTRQYHETRLAARSGKSHRSPPRNRNLLSVEMLTELGDEVVRIADHLEQFALVDYQMGFSEREIIPCELPSAPVFPAYLLLQWHAKEFSATLCFLLRP